MGMRGQPVGHLGRLPVSSAPRVQLPRQSNARTPRAHLHHILVQGVGHVEHLVPLLHQRLHKGAARHLLGRRACRAAARRRRQRRRVGTEPLGAHGRASRVGGRAGNGGARGLAGRPTRPHALHFSSAGSSPTRPPRPPCPPASPATHPRGSRCASAPPSCAPHSRTGSSACRATWRSGSAAAAAGGACGAAGGGGQRGEGRQAQQRRQATRA